MLNDLQKSLKYLMHEALKENFFPKNSILFLWIVLKPQTQPLDFQTITLINSLEIKKKNGLITFSSSPVAYQRPGQALARTTL